MTDGQTESIMAKTALCIASYADALSISAKGEQLTEPIIHFNTDCGKQTNNDDEYDEPPLLVELGNPLVCSPNLCRCRLSAGSTRRNYWTLRSQLKRTKTRHYIILH